MTPPVPIPQTVVNQDTVVLVAWRPLGPCEVTATIRDRAGTAVAAKASAPGAATCTVTAPAGGWVDPPYTLTLVATDGTGSGPPSTAVPVLLASATLVEVRYDTATVELDVRPPRGGTSLVHVPTLWFEDHTAEGFAGFAGPHGSFPFAGALPTRTYRVAITDTLEVPVDPAPNACMTAAPPSGPVTLVTQAATIAGATALTGGGYDVDAAGPASAGPPITGHRLRYGSTAPGEALRESDHEGTSAATIPDPASGGPFAVVQAAGLARSGEATVRGPFCADYCLIAQAPQAVSLVWTTAGRLRAGWAAMTPPPNVELRYEATLLREGQAFEHVTTTAAGQLAAAFEAAFEPGAIYDATVLAVSTVNSRGPPSGPARGPLRARSSGVAYDPLGRLRSLPIAGWATYAYTYDAAGNVLTVAVTAAEPPP